MKWNALTMGLLASAMLFAGAGSQSNPAALEKERRNDERVWALMRQLLVDFGYASKVTVLEEAWQRTQTPQQWVLFGWDATNAPSPEPNAVALRIATSCAQARTLGEALQRACATPAEINDIVTGLLSWTRNGGAPLLQGRSDLALHFIYAASYECLLGMGKAVSIAKEYLDQSAGKPFDLDDLAAGLAGAEWVQQARQDPEWRHAWATGAKTVERNLPALRYGTGPHSATLLQHIHADVVSAMRR